MTWFPPAMMISNPEPIEIVIVPPGPYTQFQRSNSAGVLYVQRVISAVACMLDLVAGYNSNPTSTDQNYVQLHDANAAISNGAVPKVIIPVFGGKLPYSYGVETEFTTGLVIALSTTEVTFTAVGTDWLSYNANYRTAP